jgi:hypothetical protein
MCALTYLFVDRCGCLPALMTADCCFIEDTAVVVGRTAIIARIGAAARQGEEAAVATALQQHMGCTLQVSRKEVGQACTASGAHRDTSGMVNAAVKADFTGARESQLQ